MSKENRTSSKKRRGLLEEKFDVVEPYQCHSNTKIGQAVGLNLQCALL